MRKDEPLNDDFMGAVTPQEAYCMGCSHFGACNVILKDGKICGDKYDWSVKPFEYRGPGE